MPMDQEFATEEEQRTYRMLRQALQAHTTAHRLTWDQRAHVCLALVGDSLVGYALAGAAVPALVTETMAWLTRYVQVRQAAPVEYGPLALDVEDLTGAVLSEADYTALVCPVYVALGTLRYEAMQAYGIGADGAARIALALWADTLIALQSDDLDAIIDHEMREGLAVYIRQHSLLNPGEP